MSKMDLLQGTLDLLVLRTLRHGPMHGYAVARWIKRVTENVFQIEEGALYPALHRLEERGLIEAEWGVSENNRRARFYHLTSAGRKALGKETEAWSRYVGAMAKVMEVSAGGTS